MKSRSRWTRSRAAGLHPPVLIGAITLLAPFCAAGDDAAWSTILSTQHNPGGEPGEAADMPVTIRTDGRDLYVLIQSLFPALEGQGLGGGTGRSFALLKIAGDGVELWRREYGEDSVHTYDLVSGFGPSDRALAIDSVGFPRRAGSDWGTYSPTFGHHMLAARNTWDCVTGDHIWLDNWSPGGVSNAFDHGFILDDDDNMFAFGGSQFTFCCSSSYWPYITKLDGSGEEVWFHSFEESPDRGSYRSAGLTSDGHVIAFGTAINGNFRLSSYGAGSGDLIWSMVHELADQTDSFNGRMVLDGDDNIIVIGPGYGTGNERFARVLKFDPAGDLLWESTWSSGAEHPEGTTQYFHAHPHVLDDGSFIVAGRFYFADGGWDIVMRRYAPDGSVLWHEQYDPTSQGGIDRDEFVLVLMPDPDDGIVITARTEDEDDPRAAHTGLVLRYSKDGDLLWQHEEEGPGGESVRARGVEFMTNGDLVVGYQIAALDSDAADVLLVRYGIGAGATGDLDGDGVVGVTDLLTLLSGWGPCDGPCPGSCPADIDGDAVVGVSDLLILLVNWG